MCQKLKGLKEKSIFHIPFKFLKFKQDLIMDQNMFNNLIIFMFVKIMRFKISWVCELLTINYKRENFLCGIKAMLEIL